MENEEKETFENALQSELDKLPYEKHVDDGQYNDGQLAGFEKGAIWANESQSKTIEQLTKERDEYREKYVCNQHTVLNQQNEKDGLIQENRMLKEDNGRLEKDNFHIKCDWADMTREKDREIESLKEEIKNRKSFMLHFLHEAEAEDRKRSDFFTKKMYEKYSELRKEWGLLKEND